MGWLAWLRPGSTGRWAGRVECVCKSSSDLQEILPFHPVIPICFATSLCAPLVPGVFSL
jgi:hypothetical protein